MPQFIYNKHYFISNKHYSDGYLNKKIKKEKNPQN